MLIPNFKYSVRSKLSFTFCLFFEPPAEWILKDTNEMAQQAEASLYQRWQYTPGMAFPCILTPQSCFQIRLHFVPFH